MPVANEDRERVLLRAAYDLIKKCRDGEPITEVLIEYDGAECDSQCLMEDIAIELEIEE
jgi:hypothetical protein